MSSIPQHHNQAATATESGVGAMRQIHRIGLWAARAVSTAVVVGALGGLALWGHLADWKMPSFAALLGKVEAAAPEWCQEHNVPEAECIECKRDLLPAGKDYGWCKEHGVFQCPLEHPEVAQLKETPAPSREAIERAARALAARPRAENNSLCKLHMKRIQFVSAEAIEKAGVDVAVVLERPVVEAINAPGEVEYDQTRMAHLSSRVAGAVWHVERQVGDRVRQGECLALIDAADVGKAKTELLQALAQVKLKQAHLERLESLAAGVLPARQLREAQAEWQEARIRMQSAEQSLVNLGLPVRSLGLANLDAGAAARQLHFLGLPQELVNSLDADSTTANLLPVYSPLEGVIIDRHVVAGEVVNPATVLFAVADISQMWLTLHIREEDARYVALGQTVLFRPQSGQDEATIQGAVAWVSTAADDQTRTVRVRIVLPNAAGHLRANTFGTGRIVLREESRAVVVPSEAVHWDGSCHVVFVRDKHFHEAGSPKFFHVRAVRVGVKESGLTEIIAGLLPGEVIASKNSVVLEAQLLKSNLGAGCGCAEGH